MMTWVTPGHPDSRRPQGAAPVKSLLRFIAVAGLSAGFLAIWLTRVDLGELGRSLSRARPGPLAAAALLTLVHLVVRAVRWRSLLLPAGDAAADEAGSSGEAPSQSGAAIPLADLLSFTVLGYTTTFLVPGRLGEIVRPALLWRRHAVPAGAAFASIALERLLDAVTLVVFLLAFLALRPGLAGPAVARGAAVGAVVVLGGGGVVVALHRFRRTFLERLVVRASGWLPAAAARRVEALGLAFLSGFDSLLRPGSWWRLPALSALTWLPILAFLHLSVASAGLDLPFSATLLLVPLTALGIAVPTPAGVGSYHAILTWGLAEVLGAPTGPAAAAAVLSHAASVLPVLLAGLYCLAREGMGWSSLRRVATEARRSGSPP
jgi:hypothetical protein